MQWFGHNDIGYVSGGRFVLGDLGMAGLHQVIDAIEDDIAAAPITQVASVAEAAETTRIDKNGRQGERRWGGPSRRARRTGWHHDGTVHLSCSLRHGRITRRWICGLLGASWPNFIAQVCRC